jgi:hypothetical protein
MLVIAGLAAAVGAGMGALGCHSDDENGPLPTDCSWKDKGYCPKGCQTITVLGRVDTEKKCYDEKTRTFVCRPGDELADSTVKCAINRDDGRTYLLRVSPSGSRASPRMA